MLIAYLIFIYKELYCEQANSFVNEIENLKKKMIIKTRAGKFIRINSDDNIVHLTSLYGCKISLELVKLKTHQFTFISDDYYNEYCTELFKQENEKHRFAYFLNELGIPAFFHVKHRTDGKF